MPPNASAPTFTPGGFDPYGFDDDGYGSGALYPGGAVGLKNKRAEADRECMLHEHRNSVELIISQPIHWRPNRGSPRRITQPMQRSARMSIPSKEVGRWRASSSRYDFPRDLWSLPRTHDGSIRKLLVPKAT